jgi:SRSO17 transposase
MGMESPIEQRLETYFDGIGKVLGHPSRQASFAIYGVGLLGDGERKSVEPIAARACADPLLVEPLHQRLLHFLVDSPWDDHAVRRTAAEYALLAMVKRERIDSWVLDDTGFMKQGDHSVGVQRQYTGTVGKVANCQLGVSLTLTTATEHLPVDFDLYLPKKWTEDKARRREAKIPDTVKFRTKPEIALDMLRRAVAAGLPQGVVLGDAAYGGNGRFREEVRYLGLHFGLSVGSTTTVWLADRKGDPVDDAVQVRELAKRIVEAGGFRKTTWREGTKKGLSAHFAFRRVIPAHDDGWQPKEREVLWLVMEWENGEAAPSKYHFLSLPVNTSHKRMVRCLKQRWRTERVYEDLKGELGLDHYEGRSYPGWQHHVSAVLSCYAFLIAERATSIPPSAREANEGEPLALAA